MIKNALCFLMLFLFAVSYTVEAEQNPEYSQPSNTPSLSIELTQEELSWLRSNPVIKVGAESDWPPFDFEENGEAAGYSVDLMRLAAAKVGLEYEIIIGPTWSQLMAMLRNGDIDILPAIVKTKERDEYITFTSAYMSGPVVLVTHQTDHSVRSMDDLEGKRLAVVEEYYYEALLKRHYPKVKIISVTGMLAGLQAVIDGQADAFIGVRAAIDSTVRSHLLPGLQIVGQTGIKNIDQFSFHMGVMKEQKILASIMDKGIRAISLTEKQVLYDRWIGFGLQLHNQLPSAILTESEQAFIREHPVIRASNELDWAPINFMESGLPTGFSVEYLKLVASKVGITLDFVSGEWDELMQRALNKELDVILNIVKTESRSQKLLFTKPYANTPMAIFSRVDNQHQRSITNLRGKRVAVGKVFLPIVIWRNTIRISS